MAASSSLILVLFLTDVTKKHKIKFLLAFIVILLGVAYSGTRTAYFIIISGVCLYILTTINQFRTVVFSIFALFAFFLLMYLPIYSNNTINRIRSTFEFSNDASMNVRDVNRSSIQPYIYKHAFGGGLNTSGGVGAKYNPGHILADFPPDSGYVKAAIETGWVGLFLLCIIYFITLQYGLVTYFKCKNKILKIYVFASVVCIFTFVIAQYGQEATDQIPGFFLFYSCFAVIIKSRFIDEKLN
jgi:cell division protein FtsW (lipid II flippase)